MGSPAYRAELASLLGLDESDDRLIWQFAKDNGFTIVSKDADFNALCLLRGFPPKLLWLRIGNCSVVAVERLLRHNHEAILLFDADLEAGMMALE